MYTIYMYSAYNKMHLVFTGYNCRVHIMQCKQNNRILYYYIHIHTSNYTHSFTCKNSDVPKVALINDLVY